MAKFEDLIGLVKFDLSEMPRFKTAEEDFDEGLLKEIGRVREKNEKSKGFGFQYVSDQVPPLDNLILLTAIDDYINDREQMPI